MNPLLLQSYPLSSVLHGRQSILGQFEPAHGFDLVNKDFIEVPTLSFTLTFVVQTLLMLVSAALNCLTSFPSQLLGTVNIAIVFLKSSGDFTLFL